MHHDLTIPESQEENKILDKLHCQKVAEVEKLSQTVRELEEAILAGGAAANAARDYQRKVQEMNVNILLCASHIISRNLCRCYFHFIFYL